VLYDDTGVAAWEPFGGRIEMPTLQRLADDALTCSEWHTMGLCSPTRSVFFDAADDAYVDVEAHLAAAMARD
jgi:arylsulfatase A-like enzyme